MNYDNCYQSTTKCKSPRDGGGGDHLNKGGGEDDHLHKCATHSHPPKYKIINVPKWCIARFICTLNGASHVSSAL